MDKKLILLDSDQVVCDLLPRWVKVYNERYGDNLSVEEFGGTFGGLQHVVKPECGEKIYDLMKEPGFFQSLDPVAGAIEGVNKLLDDPRFDPYVVTAYSNDPEMAKGKVEWYLKNLPAMVEKEGLILCKPKQLVIGDMLVDDSMENLKKWAGQMSALDRTDFFAVAMAAPHNQDAEDSHFVDARISSWDELLKFMDVVF